MLVQSYSGATPTNNNTTLTTTSNNNIRQRRFQNSPLHSNVSNLYNLRRNNITCNMYIFPPFYSVPLTSVSPPYLSHPSLSHPSLSSPSVPPLPLYPLRMVLGQLMKKRMNTSDKCSLMPMATYLRSHLTKETVH